MRSAGLARAPAPGWEITVPPRPTLAGVAMAGFSDRATDIVDVRVIPPPAVMVIFDLGDTPIVVDDGSGQERQRGNVVAGLAPKGVRGRGGSSFECVQVRLSPPV